MPPDQNIDTSIEGKKGKFAVIIPVYNHENGIEDVVKKSLQLNLPVFVVDDGSTDLSYEKIRNYTRINPLRHDVNRGKGAAIITGFTEAEKVADWAITIDADGQHNPQVAPSMMAAIPENERPLVVGKRQGMVSKKAPLDEPVWTQIFQFLDRAFGRTPYGRFSKRVQNLSPARVAETERKDQKVPI